MVKDRIRDLFDSVPGDWDITKVPDESNRFVASSYKYGEIEFIYRVKTETSAGEIRILESVSKAEAIDDNPVTEQIVKDFNRERLDWCDF